jgi:hypothetical protein
VNEKLEENRRRRDGRWREIETSVSNLRCGELTLQLEDVVPITIRPRASSKGETKFKKIVAKTARS